MKAAIVRVNTHLILQSLAFPDGAKVIACLGERAPLGEIELIVEHDDLRDVKEGQSIPRRVPELTLLDENNFVAFDWGAEVGEFAVSSGPNEQEALAIVIRFYNEVCRRAEANMEKTGRLEGAHYAAMRSVLAERGGGV